MKVALKTIADKVHRLKIARHISLAIMLAFLVACQPGPNKEEKIMTNPTVTFETNQGSFQLELFEKEAPATVANFLRYVDEKHYNGVIFHRVINDFMIQGGGFDKDMKEKKTHEPIRNEADNRISNTRGTIAMARTSDVHSASAQFFINVKDNDFLNFRSPTPSGYGYCVFGKVTSGMDTIDKIRKVKTGSKNGHDDVPVDPVIITKVTKDAAK